MPKTAKPANLAEEKQPALFQVQDMPALPALVEAAKRFIHSGKVTCKDEERAQSIAQAYLECGRILTVARRFAISPNTVHAVLGVLESAGKLDDLKQRVSKSLGLLAEVSAERSIELVLEGKCPPNVLPIMMGVSLDKKALLDGEATHRVEAVVSAPIGVQDVLDYLAQAGQPVPAIDVASIVLPADPKEIKP